MKNMHSHVSGRGPSDVAVINLVLVWSSLPTRHSSALLALALSGRVIKDNETRSPPGSHSHPGPHISVGNAFARVLHALHLLAKNGFYAAVTRAPL
ncbi:hypothetical protein Csa_003376 [Cucumis sativus]|uniref:Uncharacterized protein n=1 Tax=Cucumis sativus TaxID=3659 RepID=A0A0A0KI81_CUCSA|nr:hypothetical protein Csa_003376 [Cucumis sativus]